MLSFFVMSKNKDFSHSVTFQVQMRQREREWKDDAHQAPPPLAHSASSQLPSTGIIKAVEAMGDPVLEVTLSLLFVCLFLHTVKSRYTSQDQW